MRKIENPELAAKVRKRLRLIVRPQGSISARALSELIGLGANYITKRLNSDSMIPIEVISLICDHVGLSLSEFFDEKYDFTPMLPTEAELKLRESLRPYNDKDKTALADVLQEADVKTTKSFVRAFQQNLRAEKRSQKG